MSTMRVPWYRARATVVGTGGRRRTIREGFTVPSQPTQEDVRAVRAPRRTLLITGALTATVVARTAACTPEDAAAIASGRGTITFASDCEAGPTKTRFRLPLETPVMRVNLRGRAGTDVVTEFISLKKSAESVQLLDKFRTDVIPNSTSYCKALPFLDLLMRLGMSAILGGRSAEDLRQGSVDLVVDAYTGADLRASGTVTVEWEV